MAYPVFADFNTSVFDPATLTPTELCNQLKHHYDYLMTASETSSFKWDSKAYVYNSYGDCAKITAIKGGITIVRHYYYSDRTLTHQLNFIKGVPPHGTNFQFISGVTYNYDSNGNLTSITNRNQ